MASNSLAARVLYRVARALCVGFCRTWLRMRVEGLENVPQSGAYIVAPVHRSYIDTPIVSVITKRRLRYMGKDSLWKKQPAAWVLSALGGFPVSRGTADREALKRCIAVLEAGEPLVLFPEGERKSGPVIHPLFDGAVYVALKAGVPIVPVGIGGSERVMPKKAKFVYPRKVHVEIGPPIMPPVVAEGTRLPRHVYKEYTQTLHAELQRLFDIAMERVPWSYPADGDAA